MDIEASRTGVVQREQTPEAVRERLIRLSQLAPDKVSVLENGFINLNHINGRFLENGDDERVENARAELISISYAEPEPPSEPGAETVGASMVNCKGSVGKMSV